MYNFNLAQEKRPAPQREQITLWLRLNKYCLFRNKNYFNKKNPGGNGNFFSLIETQLNRYTNILLYRKIYKNIVQAYK